MSWWVIVLLLVVMLVVGVATVRAATGEEEPRPPRRSRRPAKSRPAGHRMYRDGEGDLFWLYEVRDNGDWHGAWLKIGDVKLHKVATVSASYVKAVGMYPI